MHGVLLPSKTYLLTSNLVLLTGNCSFGPTLLSAYTLAFQTHLFSHLPPTFSGALHDLLISTLPPAPADPPLWNAFERLGLLTRYESLISGVAYDHIGKHVEESCKGKWEKPILSEMRDWMADCMLPWMVLPYARGANNAEEAKAMLQGVGSRFDFHMGKTLCDLR